MSRLIFLGVVLIAVSQAAADVAVGSTREQLQKEWGAPQGQLVSGRKELLMYKNNVLVHIQDRKVVKIEGMMEAKPKAGLSANGVTAVSNPVSAPARQAKPPSPLAASAPAPAAPARPPASPAPAAPTVAKASPTPPAPVAAEPATRKATPAEARPGAEASRTGHGEQMRGLLESIDFFYVILEEAADDENKMTFSLRDGGLAISGIPKDLLRNGQTTLRIEYEAPSSTSAANATVAVEAPAKPLGERYDGKTEAEFRKVAMFGDERNERVLTFLDACRAHYEQLNSQSGRTGAIIYARNGSAVTLNGLPANSLKSGQRTITVDSRQTIRTYNGLKRDEFLLAESW